jgi:hypothetical protein
MKKIVVASLVCLALFAAPAAAQEQNAGRYSIDGKLLQAIFTYLSQEPYKDVFQLIESLQKDARPIDSEQPKEKDK